MINYQLLKKLCSESGVSGDEKRVRDIIIEEIKDCGCEYRVDNLGNLIVFKKGKNRPKVKLMLSAHMDEVGFIITHITDEGYLKFSTVGGIDETSLCGRYVTIGKNKINGVIGVKPIHLLKADEREKKIAVKNLYIDIGAKDGKQAKRVVSLGDYACFLPTFNSDSRAVRSKAIDDRIGCLALIEMIKSELLYDMTFCFVIQEEIGLRGAKVASYTVNADSAIVVEATTAADIPGSENKVCCLGDGAVVSFMDKRTIYDKEYYNLTLDLARSNDIKVQVKKAVAGGNDAGAIQSSRDGVKTIALSLPCRYIHSEMALCYKSDIEALFELLKLLSVEIAGKE